MGTKSVDVGVEFGMRLADVEYWKYLLLVLVRAADMNTQLKHGIC